MENIRHFDLQRQPTKGRNIVFTSLQRQSNLEWGQFFTHFISKYSAIYLARRIAFITVFFLVTQALFSQINNGRKKMIEFGWDYPTIDYLMQHISEMEKRPFDGVVFSFKQDIIETLNPQVIPDEYFQFDRLATIPFKKFTDNFFFVRIQGSKGGQWFDDAAWNIAEQNISKLSKAMKLSGVKGCLLDPEFYYPDATINPWSYSPSQYPQYSFDQVKMQVRKRGRQFIQALQSVQPKQVLLCMWIAGLVIAEMQESTPYEKTRQALLPAFFEGIFEAKTADAIVVDGNELSYWYKTPSDFLQSPAALRSNTASLMTSTTAKSEAMRMEIGQSLFYDGMYAAAPAFDKGFSKSEKTNWHLENGRFAFATTDRYLWYYTERLNMWSPSENMTHEAMLHLFSIYNSHRQNIETGAPTSFKGKGYFFSTPPPMAKGGSAFDYEYNSITGRLSISIDKSGTSTIKIYSNSNTIKEIRTRTRTNSIQLNPSEIGSVTIEVKFPDGTVAYAIVKM